MSLPVLVWCLLAFIWGSTWLVIKMSLDDLPPFTLMAVRFLFAFLSLCLLGFLRRPKLGIARKDWLTIALSGLLIFAFNYSAVYWAEQYISSGLAAIVYTTLPLVGGVCAHIMLPNDPLTRPKISGALMGLVGVALIFNDQLALSGTMALWGVVAIQIAVVGTAIGSAMVKRDLHDIDPIVITAGQIGFSLPVMFTLSITAEGLPTNFNWSAMALGGALYLGILGSAFTFTLLNWLYKHMDISKTMYIPFVSTLMAVFLGWLIRDETLDWRTALGTVLIMAGLFVATILGRHKKVAGLPQKTAS